MLDDDPPDVPDGPELSDGPDGVEAIEEASEAALSTDGMFELSEACRRCTCARGRVRGVGSYTNVIMT